MKYLLDKVGLVAIMGFLGILVLIVVQSNNEMPLGSTFFQSPIEEPLLLTPEPVTPFPVPSPSLFQSPLLEPTPIAWARPTLIPNDSIYVSTPTTLSLTTGGTAIGKLFSPNWDGDNIVTYAMTENGTAIVLVDPKTGQVRLLSEPQEFRGAPPRISGRYVVWADPVDVHSSLYQMTVYDLNTDRFFQPHTPGFYHQLDFSDKVAVWEDHRNGASGIYGYNVKTSQPITITQGSVGCPRVDYPWVVYLDYTESDPDAPGSMAELWAYNLKTSEGLELGYVFNPNDSTACTYHDVEKKRIAWFGSRNPNDMVPKPYVYDLRTRSDRILDIPVQWPPRVILSKSIAVFGNIGFDLKSNTQFNVIPDPQWIEVTGGPLLLSDKKVIWLTDSFAGTQQVYAAAIVRQNKMRKQ